MSREKGQTGQCTVDLEAEETDAMKIDAEIGILTSKGSQKETNGTQRISRREIERDIWGVEITNRKCYLTGIKVISPRTAVREEKAPKKLEEFRKRVRETETEWDRWFDHVRGFCKALRAETVDNKRKGRSSKKMTESNGTPLFRKEIGIQTEEGTETEQKTHWKIIGKGTWKTKLRGHGNPNYRRGEMES
ncbi:hypothetical protein JTB14_016656 [Gonioctena quinquepunctata]|nr:hypothetical protein JTB14_016656 [Gonioctena quinquepunctata]